MYLFKGFTEDEHAGHLAQMMLNGKLRSFTKKKLQDLRSYAMARAGRRGYTPESELFKFILDRWPGTDLHVKIENRKKK